MKRAAYLFILLILAVTSFSGCSMLTAQGRREHAYQRYVAKSSKGRVNQQSKIAKWGTKIPSLAPSEPVVKTDVGDGPESVTSSDGGM